ncbi:methyltransferase domain-containing protein [Roseibium sp. FZY0029]|uniref:protein-L-isoaspartate O-methyltransferase family protein n=1 Tax=Roseibium sp. FZY0029 TaxID=3116647 RepID=UPI002EA6F306|nr:methyltransferase domain-containing protein [Roseibium sp. FZY0029]
MENIYVNRPLMYLDADGEILQASNSEPAFIFHLAELLDVRPGHRVLEVGCGTGWLLALLSHAVGSTGEVFGVEINEYLGAQAQANISRMDIANATVMVGDGFKNIETAAFDRIIVTASVYEVPIKLVHLLDEGGLALLPIRNRGLSEEAQLLRKSGNRLESQVTRVCKFVPMIAHEVGSQGYILPRLEDNDTFRAIKHRIAGERTSTFGQEHVSDMLKNSLGFTGYLSKVEPDFNGFAIGDYSSGGLATAIFGDPDAYGFGLINAKNRTAAIWHKGSVTAYGTTQAMDRFFELGATWSELGRPSGYAFGLTVTEKDDQIEDEGPVFPEHRKEVTLWWKLRDPAFRK